MEFRRTPTNLALKLLNSCVFQVFARDNWLLVWPKPPENSSEQASLVHFLMKIALAPLNFDVKKLAENSPKLPSDELRRIKLESKYSSWSQMFRPWRLQIAVCLLFWNHSRCLRSPIGQFNSHQIFTTRYNENFTWEVGIFPNTMEQVAQWAYHSTKCGRWGGVDRGTDIFSHVKMFQKYLKNWNHLKLISCNWCYENWVGP